MGCIQVNSMTSLGKQDIRNGKTAVGNFLSVFILLKKQK